MQPGAAILEVSSITDSSNDCRCSLWADATYLGDTLADVALAEDGFDPLVEVSDPFIDQQQEGMQGVDDIACQLGDIDLWIVDDLRYRALNRARLALPSWRSDYNDHRPDSGLGWLTPAEFAQTINPRSDAVLRCRNGSAQ